ncbi:MAG: hypothetical protein CMJ28_03350 [Phycisphaerae bacterium]|nr:hypothetical protein [Phycisphaerae bacterium]
MKPRVVLAHDWLVAPRGGEQVLAQLADLLEPDCIVTLVDSGLSFGGILDRTDRQTSWLQKIPGASGSFRRALAPLMPLAIKSTTVPDCDLLVSSSSAFVAGLRAPKAAKHLCYCHAPIRWAREGRHAYRSGPGGFFRGLALDIASPWFRWFDWRAGQQPDMILANSAHTARRIRSAWGREALVVYPPSRTDFFKPDASAREDFLLWVGAIEPAKRLDRVMAMAERHDQKLLVVGEGSQSARLRRNAGKRITFLGRVDDEQLRKLYRTAAAFVQLHEEDFGLTVVEAMGCGCPVLVHHTGGHAEIVTEDVGIQVDAEDVKSIDAGVQKLIHNHWDVSCAVARANEFSPVVFDQHIKHALTQLGF